MEMEGTRPLAVTQAQAWEALNDPEVLKLCIPGCDKVEPSGENKYSVAMSVKIGPVSAKFNGKIALTDVQPPSSYTLTFDGQGGAAGFGKGVSNVRLTPQVDGTGCVLDYKVQAQVGGKIAQVGQRLIDGVAKTMAEDFFKRFDAEMQRAHPQAYAAREAATPAAAPVVQPASSVAVATAADTGSMMPKWVWIAITVAIAVVLVLLKY